MPNLANNKICTGCSACSNICPKKAIKMIADNEGFLQPVVDGNVCIDCKLCEQVCPQINLGSRWGDANPRTYAAWHKLDRCCSSSGGMFSAFARQILKNGGSVFGACLDEQLNCRHIEISSIEDLPLLRGSKYVQSEIGECFKTIKQRLCEGKEVLFCGTPCQVSGLNRFLRKQYDNLLTIDLACHGVPSNQVFKKYICKLQKLKKFVIKGFEFRHRDGWGIAPSILQENKQLKPIYGVDALYMSAFEKSAIFRKSCYTCQYTKIPRVGDITLADFWGIGRHGIPFKQNVMKGVSLVLANTAKGLDSIKCLDKETFIEERTLQEALIENHNLKSSSPFNSKRGEIIQSFLDESMSLNDINRKYALVDYSIKGIVKEWALKLGLFNVVKRIYNKVKSL